MAPDPFPADCASRFRNLGKLAAGGFGAVYRAEQISLSRPAAVKLLHAEVLADPEQVERFNAEARITAALAHPSIVQVLDHGAGDNIPWIAYEFLSGHSLRDLLESSELTFEQAVEATIQVADALDAAHAKSVLHRDIKPDNVLKVGEGRYKVTDFGIAKWRLSTGVKTKTGVLLGTPVYMAPELVMGSEPAVSADLYALGVMFFELVTGAVPYDGETAFQILEHHLKSPIPTATQRRPGLPAWVNAFADRMLAKDPRDRFPTAAALRDELAQQTTSSESGANPMNRTQSASGRFTRNTQAGAVSTSGRFARNTQANVGASSGVGRRTAAASGAIKRSVITRAVSPLPAPAPAASPARKAALGAAVAVGLTLLAFTLAHRPAAPTPTPIALSPGASSPGDAARTDEATLAARLRGDPAASAQAADDQTASTLLNVAEKIVSGIADPPQSAVELTKAIDLVTSLEKSKAVRQRVHLLAAGGLTRAVVRAPREIQCAVSNLLALRVSCWNMAGDLTVTRALRNQGFDAARALLTVDPAEQRAEMAPLLKTFRDGKGLGTDAIHAAWKLLRLGDLVVPVLTPKELIGFEWTVAENWRGNAIRLEKHDARHDKPPEELNTAAADLLLQLRLVLPFLCAHHSPGDREKLFDGSMSLFRMLRSFKRRELIDELEADLEAGVTSENVWLPAYFKATIAAIDNNNRVTPDRQKQVQRALASYPMPASVDRSVLPSWTMWLQIQMANVDMEKLLGHTDVACTAVTTLEAMCARLAAFAGDKFLEPELARVHRSYVECGGK